MKGMINNSLRTYLILKPMRSTGHWGLLRSVTPGSSMSRLIGIHYERMGDELIINSTNTKLSEVRKEWQIRRSGFKLQMDGRDHYFEAMVRAM
jgi:hypothetical protein